MPEGSDAGSAARANRTIVFAGGGSGGHLAPGLAIAERFADSVPEWRAHFLCSDRGVDREMLAHAGVDFTPIPAAPGSRLIRGLLAFHRAAWASRGRLEDIRADAVLSLGGFVSAPVVWAAWRLGVPVVMLNLDVVAGRANRLMSWFSARVLTAVPTRNLRRADPRVVGMPVRRSAIAPASSQECRASLGLDPHRETLLVTGASQGSSSLNRAVPAFALKHGQLLRNWQVLHLAGALPDAAIQSIEDCYRRAKVPAVVLPFVHTMGLAWGAASLAVTRAGASSVAEAARNRVVSIFVPFPHHRDQHQRLNARWLVEHGAAAMARDPVLSAGEDPDLDSVLRSVLGDASFRSAASIALTSLPLHDPVPAVIRAVREVLKESSS